MKPHHGTRLSAIISVVLLAPSPTCCSVVPFAVRTGTLVLQTAPDVKCGFKNVVTREECRAFKAHSGIHAVTKDQANRMSKVYNVYTDHLSNIWDQAYLSDIWRVGTVGSFDVVYKGLPFGCQWYADPANLEYNRFLYNGIPEGSDQDNNRNGMSDGSGWLKASFSVRVCKEVDPAVRFPLLGHVLGRSAWWYPWEEVFKIGFGRRLSSSCKGMPGCGEDGAPGSVSFVVSQGRADSTERTVLIAAGAVAGAAVLALLLVVAVVARTVRRRKRSPPAPATVELEPGTLKLDPAAPPSKRPSQEGDGAL